MSRKKKLYICIKYVIDSFNIFIFGFDSFYFVLWSFFVLLLKQYLKIISFNIFINYKAKTIFILQNIKQLYMCLSRDRFDGIHLIEFYKYLFNPII